METKKDSFRSIDTLQGVFIPEAIKGVKGIWEVTERRLKDINSPALKSVFVQQSWNSVLTLLRGVDSDNKTVIEKFKQAGITGVKIGDQIIRVSEKSEHEADVFLVK